MVYGNNPRVIVEEAIKKIPVKYSGNDNMLTAFYRETVQKRRRYISVSEAVMDVYKMCIRDREPITYISWQLDFGVIMLQS